VSSGEGSIRPNWRLPQAQTLLYNARGAGPGHQDRPYVPEIPYPCPHLFPIPMTTGEPEPRI